MDLEFSSIDNNIMKYTTTFIENRMKLRDVIVLGHNHLINKFPSISDDLRKLSNEYISAFDAETDVGIRFSYMIDEHIYKQMQLK